MIIDKNICTFSSDKGCSNCLCLSCENHIPWYGCALRHVECADFPRTINCHAVNKCMAFISVSEKKESVHS